MLASMHNLDHRLNELRPSERDHEVARWLRDAASASRSVVHALASVSGRRTSAARTVGHSTRLAAG